MQDRTLVFAGILGLVALGGCGPGAAAEAIRPNDPTASGALGEGGCHDVDKSGEPLIVDWKPDQRGDLEIAMKEGVAVVAYSCKGIKLLKECHIEGNYGFIGMTTKEQIVRLQNEDEIKANLPLGGLGIAGQIGGEISRGATLDIALVMVGKRRTTWAAPTKDDLKGQCDGATHFVRGATVGAFAMDTGTKANARAVAELFGVSAGGGSASAKQVRNKEGDLDDCKKAQPDSDKAPSQCGAPLRLVLAGLAAGTAKGETKPPEKPEKQADAGQTKIEAPEQACPKGLVFSEGKCTAANNAPAYQCNPDSSQECTAQCDKGHAGSCGALGAMYANGRQVSRDPKKAAELFQKACSGGHTQSCVNLGVMTNEGIGTSKDAAGAAKLFDKGCHDGDARGCGYLGRAYLAGDGVSADPARASGLLKHACEGGDDGGCTALGHLYLDGKGVTKDVAKGAELLKRACDGSEAASCNELGELYETGAGVRLDRIYAQILYRRGCYRNSPIACVNLGRTEMAGPGANAGDAKRQFELACNRNTPIACAYMKILFGEQRPVFPDIAQMNASQQRCNGGSARDCSIVGAFHVAQGNKVMGVTELDRACRTGDAFSCELAKKAK